jgi:hypothetical protein
MDLSDESIGDMGMRSDRFSLFRRGSVCYTQSYNRAPRKYLPARSTRESHRSAALLVASERLRDSVPVPRRGVRRLPELLDLNLVLSMVRPQGAELIVAALQDLRLRTRGTRPLRWKHLSRMAPRVSAIAFKRISCSQSKTQLGNWTYPLARHSFGDETSSTKKLYLCTLQPATLRKRLASGREEGTMPLRSSTK